MSDPSETDLAEQLAQGDLVAPVPLGASWLVPLRISGTGAAHRPLHSEFVWRSPTVWLTEKMQQRCTGLLVVIDHPVGGLLDGLADLRERMVGVTILGFVRGSELWAVARVFEESLATLIATGSIDTSPSVTFAPGGTSTVKLADGAALVVEGTPALLDHISLCHAGVWSKGSPTGDKDNVNRETIDA